MSISHTSYNFTNLQNSKSIMNYACDNFLEPYINYIGEGVDREPLVVRLTGPLIGISIGLSMVAISVAHLVEGIFKGLANFLIGACNLDKERMLNSLKSQIDSIRVVGSAVCIAAVISTFGSVGLIVAPNWTYINIIYR